MPETATHINLAVHNIDAAGYLIKDKKFSDWAAVTTFYAALHVVEAVFHSNQKTEERHGQTHEHRNRILKYDRRYQHIYKNYRILYSASLVARYLEDCSNASTHILFDKYLPPEKVISELIRDKFWQILKSAGQFLKPEFGEALTRKFSETFNSQPQ